MHSTEERAKEKKGDQDYTKSADVNIEIELPFPDFSSGMLYVFDGERNVLDTLVYNALRRRC